MRQIFVSSVQKELQEFRVAIRDYVNGDPLLSQFFTVFLFEDLPAADRRADNVYLDQITKSDLYLGLFANQYGGEDADGLSPTHREFAAATANGIERTADRDHDTSAFTGADYKRRCPGTDRHGSKNGVSRSGGFG